MDLKDTLQAGQTMIFNNNFLADILRVCESIEFNLGIKKRFQSP